LKRARLGNTPNRRPSPRRTPMRSAAKSWAGQINMSLELEGKNKEL
jgi:hypothetical protein